MKALVKLAFLQTLSNEEVPYDQGLKDFLENKLQIQGEEQKKRVGLKMKTRHVTFRNSSSFFLSAKSWKTNTITTLNFCYYMPHSQSVQVLPLLRSFSFLLKRVSQDALHTTSNPTQKLCCTNEPGT